MGDPNGPHCMGVLDPNGPFSEGIWDPNAWEFWDPNGPLGEGIWHPNGPSDMGIWNPKGPSDMEFGIPMGYGNLGPSHYNFGIYISVWVLKAPWSVYGIVLGIEKSHTEYCSIILLHVEDY